jgi:type I restriction enzyme, S subunit
MNTKFVSLKDIAEVTSGGGAPQSDNDFGKEGTPFIRAGSLPKLLNGQSELEQEKISEQVAKKHKLKKYPKNTVLFAKSGMSATKGHIYLTVGECYVVNHLAALVFNEKVSPAYIAFALKKYSPTELILDPAYPSIRLSDIANLKIPLPPLIEQKRIAELLDTADHILKLRKSAISKLNQLPHSIFVDMFGDPLNNPMNFELVKVRDICKLVNGLAFKPIEWKESGKPIIRIQNLNDENKPFNYTQENFDEKYLVKNGDVLFSWSGTPGTSFGCFKWLREDGWLNQHIFKVILDGKLITVDFFITQMNLKIGELISQAHGGVGLKHVTKKMVDELSLVLPPMKLQLDFCKRISKFEKIQRIYKDAFESINLLQSSLQHKLFAVN